jgi:hypothetical protein
MGAVHYGYQAGRLSVPISDWFAFIVFKATGDGHDKINEIPYPYYYQRD